ncbi:MAG: hypothetical protein IID38_01355, partial [Planctomycetes bacterium]|nr:hypothetical protein [Planctomycetota bacterium]
MNRRPNLLCAFVDESSAQRYGRGQLSIGGGHAVENFACWGRCPGAIGRLRTRETGRLEFGVVLQVHVEVGVEIESFTPVGKSITEGPDHAVRPSGEVVQSNDPVAIQVADPELVGTHVHAATEDTGMS